MRKRLAGRASEFVSQRNGVPFTQKFVANLWTEFSAQQSTPFCGGSVTIDFEEVALARNARVGSVANPVIVAFRETKVLPSACNEVTVTFASDMCPAPF